MPDSEPINHILFTCARIMPMPQINNRVITDKAQQFWQRFSESADLENTELTEADIKPVFGLSEFIAEKLIAHPDWYANMLANNWHIETPTPDYKVLLKQQLDTCDNEDALHKILRQFRHFHMMTMTWRDVTNAQSIEASLKQVSTLADALITGTYEWVYAQQCKQSGTPMGAFGPQPLVILGMGKLGGHELNFSSDIDLIFAYPEKGETEGGRKPLENQQFFTRVAQKLINALNKTTVDGQVFRVDMRLRPFGESGPLTLHFAAMEDYYQEQGRHWERFAMVKARILNAPDAYTEQLADILKPFTFRRYLDFTTIDSLRNMKQLIATEIRRRRLTGNIKLGAGGIREVEFFAQSFQLIHGGREPALQHKSLLTTLSALKTLELVEAPIVESLRSHYLFLRKVEHTLQQINDEQTQTLPDDEWQQAIVATVCGFESYQAFLTALDQRMAFIHSQFNELVEETHESHSQDDSLFAKCRDAWQLGLDEVEFSALFTDNIDQDTARDMFQQLSEFRLQLRGYRIGQRGEDTLQKLMPELMYVLISQAPQRSHEVLSRVLQVINAITGRTTYLDLLLENPDVLQQLVKLCARSRWIAEQIQRFPLLLDELLTPLYLQQQNTDISESQRQYADELRQTLLRVDEDDIELMMDSWRQFKLCQQLRIAASDVSGSLPIAKVSDKLTVLAEVMLDAVIHHAWQHVSGRYGVPDHLTNEDIGFAVIGYGKLGGYELGYGSDLDLVFLHNAPRNASTNGAKSVSAQQFYIKLAQRIMHLLNTKTLFGQLYETDLRLRPSGNSGLLCCHIDGFETYQQEEAWTWEHQALVRARGILGDQSLLRAFDAVRHRVLSKVRDTSELNEQVSAMRKKMREHLLSKSSAGIDLKQCEGGITDIEFLTQYWVLANAARYPELTRYTDNLRILDGAEKCGVISADDAQLLQSAYLNLRDHYHQLTLADHKLAEESVDLDVLREQVTSIWQGVFGPSPLRQAQGTDG